MPSERERNALRDILHNIDLAERFIEGQTFESFQSDELHLYAVIRCLEIISEASRRVSPKLKARHPNVAWRGMAGAGNIYRHDYRDVLTLRIWETVRFALPQLRKVIEQELAAGAG
jgi:uncharacterized protein with HEPN domain